MTKKYNWNTERCIMIHKLIICKNSLEFLEILMEYFEGFFNKKKYAKMVLKELKKGVKNNV